MASNFPAHLHAAELGTELEATLQACKTWLPTASFSVTKEGFEVCGDLPDLEWCIQSFMEMFNPGKKFSSEGSRVAGIRIKKPIDGFPPDITKAILIPIIIFQSSFPKLSDQPLKLGTCVYLTESISVEPGFYGLLLLPASKPAPGAAQKLLSTK